MFFLCLNMTPPNPDFPWILQDSKSAFFLPIQSPKVSFLVLPSAPRFHYGPQGAKWKHQALQKSSFEAIRGQK